MSLVSLVKCKERPADSMKEAIREALKLISYSFPKAKSIVIKPNMCYYWDYSTGQTTDPNFVAAIISLLREEISPDVEISIVESDASARAILRPHVTIVDGLVALGRFPVKLDLIMAGVDPFSVDWVASDIMGFNPSRVGFLRTAMKEKLGNSSGIATCGENVAEFKKVFPGENFASWKYSWSILFGLMKMYRKITGDVIPPVLEE